MEEDMKLIKMTDFVLQIVNEDRPCDRGAILDGIVNYAEFIRQPLKLEMFVPCDEEGNVLDSPTGWGCGYDPDNPLPDEYMEDYLIYRKANEKVLFQDFKICNRNEKLDCVVNKDFHLSTDFKYTKTIEDLISITHIYLTPLAIKQIAH